MKASVAVVGLIFGLCLQGCRFINRYPHPDALSGKSEAVEVYYMQYACDCAQWMPVEVSQYFESIGEDYVPDGFSIYIEPAQDSTLDLEAFGCCGNHFRLQGQYYEGIGYPLGYRSQEGPEPARVFRYTSASPIYPILVYGQYADSAEALPVELKDAAALQAWIDSHPPQ